MNYPKSHLISCYIGFEYKIFDKPKLQSISSANSKKQELILLPKKIQTSNLILNSLDNNVNEINHLNGAIGPIFMFEDVFSDDIIKKINELEEEYESFIYRNYDFSHISMMNKQCNIINCLSKMDSLKIEQNLFLYISPNVSYSYIYLKLPLTQISSL